MGMVYSYIYKKYRKWRLSKVFIGYRNRKLTGNGLINTATGNIHEMVAQVEITCTI